MQPDSRYAAFIMTFQRNEILVDTIQKLLEQTKPPAKILIVDNDPEKSACRISESFPGIYIDYHATGYNSGPAGAAYYALKILFEEGWQWILWMDDNDPPHFKNVIENILQIPERYDQPEKIGMIGAVGVLFDKKIAKTIRIPDDQLMGILEVDNIAGNMLPMIHRRVLEKNIFPDKDLFFGFEELDYSLAIKRGGFAVLVSGEELLRHRKNANRMNFSRKVYQVKKIDKLWREFYSVRNVTYILKYKEKAFAGVASLLFKVIAKSVIGFRWGLKYGSVNLKYLWSGYYAGFTKHLGKKTF